MDWKKTYKDKAITAQEAVQGIRSGDHIFIGSCSSTPQALIDALCERREELTDVRLCGGLVIRNQPFHNEGFQDHIQSLTNFLGSHERAARANGYVDFSTTHLSEHETWTRDVARSRVAFFEVSPPDRWGYMSYGASGVSLNHCAKQLAKSIIVQVNKRVPYVYGQDNLIHVDEVDHIVESTQKLPTLEHVDPTETERKVASHIIAQIPDGATIQLGIGGIANAIGYGLEGKNDIGIHSEMMTESMLYLIQKGVVTGKRKTFMPGKVVMAFSMGSHDLYDYLHENPMIHAAPYAFVNDINNIAQNDGMISINAALMADLTGQVFSEAIGYNQYSCTGGQVDFVRGAQRAKNGKSFIALTSTFTNGKTGEKGSRIVLAPPPGTAVTTSRADLQYIATEYGCVNMKTMPMRQRVAAMIGLAHPDFRDELTEDAKRYGLL
jgi:4-hydroxybutyrate CoA-transferase